MKYSHTLLAILLFVLPAMAGAENVGLPMVKPEKVGLSKDRLQRFTDHIERYIEAGQLAGANIAIARRGKLAYLKTLGWANIEEKKSMERDTIFRIHSMTKPIASVAAMILLEEGRIKLTDPVSDYIPEFADVRVFIDGTSAEPNMTAPTAPITIQHLLAHISGMGGMGYETHPVGQIFDLANPYGNNPTLKEFAVRIAKLPLAQQPGTEFIYGPSTDILGRVIEVASEQSFDDFLSTRILDPLGMKDTHFIVPQGKRNRFAVAYETGEASSGLSPVTRPEHESRWQPGYRFRSGGGGLVSTISDYLRFSQMLLNEGELDGVRILAPKTVQLMSTSVVKSHESEFLKAVAPGYGFGLGVAVLDDVAASGKPGSVGEYFWAGAADTYFFIDPAEELIGLLMTQNYPAGVYKLREELQTFAYQAIVE